MATKKWSPQDYDRSKPVVVLTPEKAAALREQHAFERLAYEAIETLLEWLGLKKTVKHDCA